MAQRLLQTRVPEPLPGWHGEPSPQHRWRRFGSGMDGQSFRSQPRARSPRRSTASSNRRSRAPGGCLRRNRGPPLLHLPCCLQRLTPTRRRFPLPNLAAGERSMSPRHQPRTTSSSVSSTCYARPEKPYARVERRARRHRCVPTRCRTLKGSWPRSEKLFLWWCAVPGARQRQAGPSLNVRTLDHITYRPFASRANRRKRPAQ